MYGASDASDASAASDSGGASFLGQLWDAVQVRGRAGMWVGGASCGNSSAAVVAGYGCRLGRQQVHTAQLQHHLQQHSKVHHIASEEPMLFCVLAQLSAIQLQAWLLLTQPPATT